MTEADWKNLLACVNRVKNSIDAEAKGVAELEQKIVAEIAKLACVPKTITLPPVMEEPS